MSYGVGLQNGILEDKHRLAMGNSLWLYMWFILRQTRGSDQVLGGRPIRHADILNEYATLSERTYNLYVATLRKHGYITTKRTPRGLIITITKPKKWVESRDTAYQKAKSDPQQMVSKKPSDPQQKVERSATNDISNIRVIKNNNIATRNTGVKDDLKIVEMPDLDQPVDALTSNELKPKSLRRDRPDINGVVFAFEKAMGVKLKRVATQRNMAKHLIQHYGSDDVLSAIKAVGLVRDERYAPQILDLQDLWEKWDKLGAYFRRKRKDQEGKVAVIEND